MGALLRQHVSAAEATQLGPGEFIIEGVGGSAQLASNQTGFKGVSQNRGGFKAHLHGYGVRKHLGTYATAEKAAEAYDKGARACGVTTVMCALLLC